VAQNTCSRDYITIGVQSRLHLSFRIVALLAGIMPAVIIIIMLPIKP
jgi:hypothetical protein